ncbi:MAG: ankyrin repeat domain-containing protein, partial [Treponemataceae bacterium]|nr:ankyrin repeat domain-containing protein [Treponemataceae bacterium]
MRKFMKKNWCVAFVALALCATAACKKSDTGKNQVKKIGTLMRTLEALGTEEAAEIRECIRQNAGNLNPRSGFAPLMLAATKNATDVAKLLIKAGANVNAKDKDDRSALIYAADDNAIDMAQLLIKSGADV